MRTGKIEVALNIGVNYSNNLLVIRKLNLERIINFCNLSAIAFKLTFNINKVANL